MTNYKSRSNGIFALQYVDVGAANSRKRHAYERFSIAWLWNRDTLDCDLIGSAENERLHLFRSRFGKTAAVTFHGRNRCHTLFLLRQFTHDLVLDSVIQITRKDDQRY